MVKQTQAFGTRNTSKPAELTTDGFGLDFSQQIGGHKSSTGFWSQFWKKAEECYSSLEKQLHATYAALPAKKPITREAPVKVVTTFPISVRPQKKVKAP